MKYEIKSNNHKNCLMTSQVENKVNFLEKEDYNVEELKHEHK